MANFNFSGGDGPVMPLEDYEKLFGRSAGLGGLFGAPSENQIGQIDAYRRNLEKRNFNQRLDPLYRQQQRLRPQELSQNLFNQLMQEVQRQRGANYTGPLKDALSQIRGQTGAASPAYAELLKELESQRGERKRVQKLPRGYDKGTIDNAMNLIRSQAGTVAGDFNRQLEARAAASGMGGGALTNAQILANRDLGKNVSEATSGFMTQAGQAEQAGRFNQADAIAKLMGLSQGTAGMLGDQSQQSLQYQLPFMQALAEAGPNQAKLIAGLLGQAQGPASDYGRLMLGQEQQLSGLAESMAGNAFKHQDLLSNLLGLRGQAAGQRQQANIAGASTAGDLAGRELKQYGVEAENFANASAAQQLQDLMNQRKPMFAEPQRNMNWSPEGVSAPQWNGPAAQQPMFSKQDGISPLRPADTSQGLGGTRGPANTVQYNGRVSPSSPQAGIPHGTVREFVKAGWGRTNPITSPSTKALSSSGQGLFGAITQPLQQPMNWLQNFYDSMSQQRPGLDLTGIFGNNAKKYFPGGAPPQSKSLSDVLPAWMLDFGKQQQFNF